MGLLNFALVIVHELVNNFDWFVNDFVEERG